MWGFIIDVGNFAQCQDYQNFKIFTFLEIGKI
jgi:hypothetical protein